MLLKIALLSTISTDLKLERVRHVRYAVRAQKAMTVLSLESWVVELTFVASQYFIAHSDGLSACYHLHWLDKPWHEKWDMRLMVTVT